MCSLYSKKVIFSFSLVMQLLIGLNDLLEIGFELNNLVYQSKCGLCSRNINKMCNIALIMSYKIVEKLKLIQVQEVKPYLD